MQIFKKNGKQAIAHEHIKTEADSYWQNLDYTEGQLSIDVYQTEDNLVVKSTIAGVDPDKIEISINSDMLTIRGERNLKEEVDHQDFLYQECYWGRFSRTIILPVAIKEDEVEASLEQGVLTIILPKAHKTRDVRIKVKN